MTPFYRAARFLCLVVFKILWRYRATGSEHVPRTGPVIVAGNHVSYLDPVAMGIGMPRQLTYLAKKELFAIPILGALIVQCGAYPLDREAGGAAGLRAALRVLKDGKCIGIFPEGGRNTGEQKGGVALLAALSGAPVVPAAIVGSKNAKRFGQIRVAYGEPLTVVRDRKADGDDLEKWTGEIMRRIRALEESIGAH
jgi:1-acyl-sn-glycerol-3-phosphate acyltransferase